MGKNVNSSFAMLIPLFSSLLLKTEWFINHTGRGLVQHWTWSTSLLVYNFTWGKVTAVSSKIGLIFCINIKGPVYVNKSFIKNFQ